MGNKKYLVKTIFLDKKNKLSQTFKTYNYIMDASLITKVQIGSKNNEGVEYSYYKIVNNEGFNYANSSVIFVGVKSYHADDNFKTIITAVPDGTLTLDKREKEVIQELGVAIKKDQWHLSSTSLISELINMAQTTFANTNCCTSNSNSTSNTTINTATSIPISGVMGHYPSYGTISIDAVSNWQLDDLKKEIDSLKKEISNKQKNKGENKMFENLTKNLKCGRAQDVRMSIYGPAFKGEDGNWYAVGADDVLTDVFDLLLDMDSYCYMMPVAKNQVKEGDFILHNGRWAKVISVDKERVDGALDIFKKEFIVPALTKSPFGFEFYTKLVPLLDFSKFQANTNTPFGALPMILMMNNKNDKDMLPMLMMMGTQGGFDFDMSNPLMMYFLMKDEDSSLLPFLMMGQMNKSED